ncbi:hypothetical protein V5799_013668 [Amblyomma americanum]|uniref:Uncharacterized protein n=1 Tax=Amblyomma americanum TaxID=6943 RepID=A0AAQ4E583_AMBAM
MRFFKRRSPEPPELVRLWRLPPEVGPVHGGEGEQAPLAAPLFQRAALSRSASPATPTALLRLRRGECCSGGAGSVKEAMALSSETRGAGGPVDVVSPSASSVSRCCFVEATGAARTATPPGSAKLKRGSTCRFDMQVRHTGSTYKYNLHVQLTSSTTHELNNSRAQQLTSSTSH